MEEENLKSVATMALGWMVAKSSHEEFVVIALAQALKKSGVQSSYVDQIVESYEHRRSLFNKYQPKSK